MQNIKSDMNQEGPTEFDDSKYNRQINLLEDRLKKLQQQSGSGQFLPPPSSDRPFIAAAGDIQSDAQQTLFQGQPTAYLGDDLPPDNFRKQRSGKGQVQVLNQEKNAAKSTALDHDAEDKGSIERKQRSASPTAEEAQDDEECEDYEEEDALVQLDLAKA